MERFHLDTLFMILLWLYPVEASLKCDKSRDEVDEGIIGQTRSLPWLGVLRVHLHKPLEDGDKSEVALTGLVLVSMKHALVNADDVARIPENVFREDTRAMFVVAPEVPWFCPVLSYVVHPEYEQKTWNTIAVVELGVYKEQGYALPRPICWPRKMAAVSQHFYLAGYTDENRYLEKMLYRLHYRDRPSCDDFYNKAELDDKMRVPLHYFCGESQSSRGQCVWDNGMVLASNDSTYFTLLGLSVRGPGCAAPARFIDLRRYHQWVETTMALKAEPEENHKRDDEPEPEPDNVPVHDYFDFRKHDTRRNQDNVSKPERMRYELYPFDTTKPSYFNVDKIDNKTLAVFSFNGTFEAYEKVCSVERVLIYKEDLELKSKSGCSGTAYYKISLYDLIHQICGCIIVKMDTEWQTEATIAYKEFLEVGEGLSITSSEETPDILIRHFFIEERNLPPKDTDPMVPNKVLRPEYVDLSRRTIRVLNYDLYIQFGFQKSAKMTIEMYSENKRITRTTRQPVRRFAGLTNEEERMHFRKQQRIKMTKPPGRRKWYEAGSRHIRSGLVEDVPQVVRESFGKDQSGERTSEDRSPESESSKFLKEAIKSMENTEFKNDLQNYFGTVSKSDEYKPAPANNDLKSSGNTKSKPFKITPSPSQGTFRCTYLSGLIIAVLSIDFIVDNLLFKL